MTNYRRRYYAGNIGVPFILAMLVASPILVFIGCSTIDGKTTVDSEKGVYAVAVALTAADKTATHYITLPLCGPTHAKPLCSEAAVSAKIKTNAQKAHDAVKAAKDNPGLVDAAQAAVDTLVQSTPKTGE